MAVSKWSSGDFVELYFYYFKFSLHILEIPVAAFYIYQFISKTLHVSYYHVIHRKIHFNKYATQAE